jgi:hypothetical protein
MKETSTYCDHCLTSSGRRVATAVCVICQADCCADHMSGALPRLAAPYFQSSQRQICAPCGATSSQIIPEPPPDLEAALTAWQDKIIEQIRARIAAAALAASENRPPNAWGVPKWPTK